MIRPRVAAAAVVAQTIAMAALFAVALGLLSDEDPFDGSLRDFAVVAGMHLVDGALIAGLLLGWARLSPSELGWRRADPIDLALGLVGALLCVGLVAAVGGGGFLEAPLAERLLGVEIGLGAAAIEETVFRGTLQPVLVRRLGRPAGILAMALIFSAYHLKFAPVGFLVKAGFGVIFGSLREATGRNWAPALAHLGVWTVVGFS
jgi:membrane protease YdiL (CAAX protease family)